MKLEELLNKYSLNADKLSEIEKEEKQQNPRRDDPSKWTPQAGRTVIRILPSNEDEDMTKAGPRWYRKMMVNYVDGKAFICPKSINLHDCPCCDFTWKVLWPQVKDLPKEKRGNSWNQFLPKERFVSKVLVRKFSEDPLGKISFNEIEEDEFKSELKHPQVRLFDYAKTYYDEIKAIIESGPQETGGYGDVLNILEGRDLFIIKNKSNFKKGEQQDASNMQKSMKINPSSMSSPVFSKSLINHYNNQDLFVDTFIKMMDDSPTINSRYDLLSKEDINKLLDEYRNKMITGEEVEKIPGTDIESEPQKEDDFNHGTNSEFAMLAAKLGVKD